MWVGRCKYRNFWGHTAKYGRNGMCRINCVSGHANAGWTGEMETKASTFVLPRADSHRDKELEEQRATYNLGFGFNLRVQEVLEGLGIQKLALYQASGLLDGAIHQLIAHQRRHVVDVPLGAVDVAGRLPSV